MTSATIHPPAWPVLTRALLACGIAYAVLYVVANDVVAASLYQGYSRLDQAVSELSATSAPTKSFLQTMLPAFTLLMLGFAFGVWRAAGERRLLRVAAVLLFASSVLGVMWLFFPMTTRLEMKAGAMPGNDVGHLVLSGLTVALILSEMALTAAALGRVFRVFTAMCAAALLGFGALMSVGAAQVASGSTPNMGLFERLMLGGWLAWMSGLAVALLRRQAPARD